MTHWIRKFIPFLNDKVGEMFGEHFIGLGGSEELGIRALRIETEFDVNDKEWCYKIYIPSTIKYLGGTPVEEVKEDFNPWKDNGSTVKDKTS